MSADHEPTEEATRRIQAAIRIQAANARAKGWGPRVLEARVCAEAERLAMEADWPLRGPLRRVLMAEVRELPHWRLRTESLARVEHAWNAGRWKALRAHFKALREARGEVAG